ncbi:hypothetical protein QYF36_011991 [Acer negundo]|nr:hypothetical protein QYF36_011991 [Acer negundo]
MDGPPKKEVRQASTGGREQALFSLLLPSTTSGRNQSNHLSEFEGFFGVAASRHLELLCFFISLRFQGTTKSRRWVAFAQRL